MASFGDYPDKFESLVSSLILDAEDGNLWNFSQSDASTGGVGPAFVGPASPSLSTFSTTANGAPSPAWPTRPSSAQNQTRKKAVQPHVLDHTPAFNASMSGGLVLQDDAVSRTLFVRNISSNTEDEELVSLFGSYGDIKALYTLCKYRGFVMISFFDERAAVTAMHCLQGKSLRRRKMDIHFSIPKENQIDTGTLVVSNVSSGVSFDKMVSAFQAFGDIKHIKGNPYSSVRLVGFYDERCASMACKGLNATELWGSQIRMQFAHHNPVRHTEYHPSAYPQHMARMVHMQPQMAAMMGMGNVPSFDGAALGMPRAEMMGQRAHQGALGAKGKRQSKSRNLRGAKLQGGGVGVGPGASAPSMGAGPTSMAGSGPYAGGRDYVLNSAAKGGLRQGRGQVNHFTLDLENIVSSRDGRTTVMLKNIPNKYTQKMLLAEVDEHLKDKYDFFYLPIDFKNKCNVGYAFINVVEPVHILTLYYQFNGKRWPRFNSGKIAEITYARIQGKSALAAHFRNSTLMTIDESCRPILFDHKSPADGAREVLAGPGFAAKAAQQQGAQQHSRWGTLNAGVGASGGALQGMARQPVTASRGLQDYALAPAPAGVDSSAGSFTPFGSVGALRVEDALGTTGEALSAKMAQQAAESLVAADNIPQLSQSMNDNPHQPHFVEAL